MDFSQAISIGDGAKPSKRKLVAAIEDLVVIGQIRIKCHRRDGSLKWDSDWFDNLITNEGKQYLLEVALKGAGTQAQISSWYMGLVDNVGASVADTDTALSFGFTEITDYDGVNRPDWESGAVSGIPPEVDNAAQASPHFDWAGASGGPRTAKGAFVINVQGKGANGSASDVLFSGGDFDGAETKEIADGESLDVTYKYTT